MWSRIWTVPLHKHEVLNYAKNYWQKTYLPNTFHLWSLHNCPHHLPCLDFCKQSKKLCKLGFLFVATPCHCCSWSDFYTVVFPNFFLPLITRVYRGLIDVANIWPYVLLFGFIVASKEKKWTIVTTILKVRSLHERYIFIHNLNSWGEMDGAICHPAACGCDGNDMEAQAKMVQDELAIIVATVHEETIVVVSKLTTSNNVPTCPWHNVQSMV